MYTSAHIEELRVGGWHIVSKYGMQVQAGPAGSWNQEVAHDLQLEITESVTHESGFQHTAKRVPGDRHPAVDESLMRFRDCMLFQELCCTRRFFLLKVEYEFFSVTGPCKDIK